MERQVRAPHTTRGSARHTAPHVALARNRQTLHTQPLRARRPRTRPAHAPCYARAAEEKIARVSGAELDLFEHSLTLEIRGTDEERGRAKK